MEQQKALHAVMICLLLIAMAVVGRETAVYVETVNAVSVLKEERHTPGEESPVVVIDAGHGGDDPGKIGINGSLEKDINLNIVNKLAGYLEAEGVQVVLTRDTEEGLYDAHASNKKVQDMKRRIEKIEETDPVLTVSVHQNSYPEEYVHGAQVFYYKIKANESYYLLKKTKGTIVIVECGFLSNAAEAEKLCTETYQDRVAWSIHKGILQYIAQLENQNREN